MEFAITIAIVAAAGTFVIWRWVRSAKRALTPAPPGACGGGCEGCTVPVELRQELTSKPGSAAPADCIERRPTDTTSPGGR